MRKTGMKKTFFSIASIALVSSVLITGCSQGNGSPSASASSVSSSSAAVDTKSAAKFTQTFLEKYYNISLTDAYTKMAESTGKYMSKIDANASATDPAQMIESLSEEDKKALLSEMSKADPLTDMISFDNMKDSEQIVLHAMLVGVPSMMLPNDSKKFSVEVDPSKISVKDNTASVSYEGITIKKDDESSSENSTKIDNVPDLPLVLVEGSWKIDGAKYYQSILRSASNAAKDTPSEAASTESPAPAATEKSSESTEK